MDPAVLTELAPLDPLNTWDRVLLMLTHMNEGDKLIIEKVAPTTGGRQYIITVKEFPRA